MCDCVQALEKYKSLPWRACKGPCMGAGPHWSLEPYLPMRRPRCCFVYGSGSQPGAIAPWVAVSPSRGGPHNRCCCCQGLLRLEPILPLQPFLVLSHMLFPNTEACWAGRAVLRPLYFHEKHVGSDQEKLWQRCSPLHCPTREQGWAVERSFALPHHRRVRLGCNSLLHSHPEQIRPWSFHSPGQGSFTQGTKLLPALGLSENPSTGRSMWEHPG